MKQLLRPSLEPSQDVHSQPSKKRPRLPWKWLMWMGTGIAIALLMVWAFRPTPLLVDVGKIERGALQVTVDAEGKTRVRDRFTIAAGVNGQLQRITLDAGDRVTPNMVVAQIDALPQTAAVQQALAQLSEWRAQRAGVETQRPKSAALQQDRDRIASATANQQQAEARVAQAQAALTQAQRDRQRAQELQASGAISRQVREQAELTERTRAQELAAAQQGTQAAQAEVAAARQALALLQQQTRDPDYLLRVYDARIASTEAQLAQLQDSARRTEMRSPVSGTVLRVLQQSAQFVNEGTPLMEVGNLSKLELVIDVLSNDAVKIQSGNAILVQQGDDSPVQAKVRIIEPSAFTKVSALGVEEQRVNIIGDFVEDSTRFGDGYRVDARIVVWQSQDVLKVPLSALFRCQQQWCVFRVDGDRAQKHTIEIGHRSDLEAEVRRGVSAGEKVILHPTEQIKNGQQVTSK